MQFDVLLSNVKGLLRKLNPIPVSWRERYKAFSQRKPLLAKIALGAVIAFSTLFLLLVLLLFLLFSGSFGPLPTVESLKKIDHNLASEVYSSDGVLLGRYYIENRLPASMEEIPECLKQALIAAEDARFYKHHGIDYRALGRVFVKSIMMQEDESGGGSTITQQLAKNLFPRKKFWFFSLPINKAKEMVIATRLEKVYTKEEIIALYLNTIPFSGNVFGIKTAASRFFNIEPSKLKPEQAAVLVGMLKATTAYHPIKNPERSKKRRNAVMARMERNGFLTKQELDSLQELPLKLDYKVRTHNEGIGTHFREHLRLQLEEELEKLTKPDGSAYNIYTDGLKIYTTIDSRLQQFAENATEEEMRKIQGNYFKFNGKEKDARLYGNDNLLNQQVKLSDRVRIMQGRKASKKEIAEALKTPAKMTILNWKTGLDVDTMLSPVDSVKYYLSLLNTGFMAADYKTGKVLAWVGGINFKYNKFDHIKSRRQVGSTFKPVLYSQALEGGMDPCKNWHNEHITYEEFEGWAPKNVDDEYGGYYNMEGALKRSINTIAVQVILEVKVDSVRNMAQKMGISSPIPKEAGIALGGVDLTLFEMVNAFSTIANRGKRPVLHYVTKIETNDGEVIKGIGTPNPKSFTKAMSEMHADMMRSFLQKVVDSDHGTAHRLRKQLKQKLRIAAKTGTSNDNRDGWFIGFTPDICFGAWVGGEHQQVRFLDTKLGQGSSTALPICSNFLNQVYGSKAFEKWLKNDFPEMDSITLDRLDCYGFRHPKNDSTDVEMDSIIAAPATATPVVNEVKEEQF
ncbi:MAG: transglycosylase domain-containing protein [Saprospiraceae bacterium]|nr:transglycosylase domain-containing protein [Saprospiraceae bacterium]